MDFFIVNFDPVGLGRGCLYSPSFLYTSKVFCYHQIQEISMKKIVLLVLILMAAMGSLFAQGLWVDGTYTANGTTFDNGWKNTVTVVVKGGYIVDAHFDAIPEAAGTYKYLRSVQGEYGMFQRGGAQSPWYVQADVAVAELLKVQDPANLARNQSAVDAISGVSITIMPHYVLVQQALRSARR